MKIVVAGALGHIGSGLIRGLSSHFPGLDVVMIDNLSTQRYASLFDLPASGRYRFVEGDVTTMDLAPLITGADAVVQLAAMTDAAGSFDRKDELEINNFHATKTIAEACLKAGVPLVHPSSTSVYGTQNEVVDEDCGPDELAPQSPYADCKLKEEALLAEMGKSGLKFITCRFGTIFGTSPGMRFHTAVNKFCWQAVMGQKLTVWSTAYDQKRPYLDLADCIRAVSHIIGKGLFDGRIHNVLTANCTVRQIVDAIRVHVPDLEVGFVDARIMNQLSYEVANRRFRDTGFEFKGSVERGIEDTVRRLAGAGGRTLS
ncbi:putative NAD-dependent epimerase [Magnetospirillum sp. XM-1]|uniref:SDR family oxidoreductase n=1 Tax=Magnetospirillum sp. XM-1 TaxID=1663591 RepID=UPI00073DC895|nr:SDR family oxidoreductase [Magnetospirillum sp. XM-1]CUW37986.1 putative NAD-dependent epimerase [Magnetospirillum sp. XM-1]